MLRRLTSLIVALCVATGHLGCVTITGVNPNPASPKQKVLVDLKNVIGPGFLEPGVQLRFDRRVMHLNPNSSSQVGFIVPVGTAPGTHEIEVTDVPGFIELITVIFLLRDRTDTADIEVQ